MAETLFQLSVTVQTDEKGPRLQKDSSTNVGGSKLPELPLTVANSMLTATLTASLTSSGATGRRAATSLPRT